MRLTHLQPPGFLTRSFKLALQTAPLRSAPTGKRPVAAKAVAVALRPALPLHNRWKGGGETVIQCKPITRGVWDKLLLMNIH